MSKIAIITDSNSGITQKQARDLGAWVLPMPFTINGTAFYEDINLTQDEFYEKLMNNAELFTSQPIANEVTTLWDRVLQDHDEIVYIPMSSGLSGSYQTAALLSQEYDGKVHVVDSKRISVALRRDVLDALKLVELGKTASQIKDILEGQDRQHDIFITVNTLEYLAKGGRITPAVAMLGGMLKIKPVLRLSTDKLDTYSKTRTMKKGTRIMIDALKNVIEEKFDGNIDKVNIDVAYTYDRDLADDLKKELMREFNVDDIEVDPLSLSVSCHIGPHALAICVCNKL
ncbi:MAG: DegV family protein [Erysipelotrichaceae bacterium]|nr:DegV family protein [Erysipelotrichaceae bacterium]